MCTAIQTRLAASRRAAAASKAQGDADHESPTKPADIWTLCTPAAVLEAHDALRRATNVDADAKHLVFLQSYFGI